MSQGLAQSAESYAILAPKHLLDAALRYTVSYTN